jgi:3-isopropylmalate/(R)-2-methylmalate dehydratase small subunit
VKKFERFESLIVPLLIDNVDTDQIIPARFLKTISKEGLGAQLFYDWRYDAEGDPKPDFVLNQPQVGGARILLAGDNFGCGSSREHAPWALIQFGFRAVISTSFADIFRQNALKNFLLPVVVPPEIHGELVTMVELNPAVRIVVDLAEESLHLPDGRRVRFPIDGFARRCLLEGVDELGYVLNRQAAISEYESTHRSPIDTLHQAGRMTGSA